jgi:serine/threonine-protein kinase RsbW
LHIPSQLGWERTAMAVAASVAMLMGFPGDQVEDIKTAVGEATLNAIEHGNALDSSQMVLIILIPEGRTLEISVRDASSRPFVPTETLGGAPNLEQKLAGSSDTRGWGTFLIKSLMDEAEFSSTSDGNLVRMVMHLQS